VISSGRVERRVRLLVYEVVGIARACRLYREATDKPLPAKANMCAAMKAHGIIQLKADSKVCYPVARSTLEVLCECDARVPCDDCSTLCTECSKRIPKLSVRERRSCDVCQGQSDLHCANCSRYFHNACLKEPLRAERASRNWLCPNCYQVQAKAYLELTSSKEWTDRLAAKHNDTQLLLAQAATRYGAPRGRNRQSASDDANDAGHLLDDSGPENYEVEEDCWELDE